ncbi:hypothetical protein ABK249_05625 [Neorhizobium sp. Rsf11]|uniref:pEK499-p136 HEPN domain-containing protein n=2 Tax=Neorhizobium TaxID=1525371 RepID=A0ABV0M064_9HYPH|nr:hypothetical protein [Neorhizobium petrolearium]MCC2611427.1 hypothetical protein [Neorhizobium petrolearium]WGI66620.1 hypothetical protein QEO92_16505 [Neorhizobium petrolearium]
MIIDGATNWGADGPRPAAEGFDVEARSKSIYEWVRQVRGGVLAGAFTVERHISVAITHFMLGDRIGIPEVRDAFDEGLLGPLAFERRINVVMQIAPHVLSSDEAASLKADLSELRTLRNAMAHKPFWLHPELNDEREVVNLVPIMQRGKGLLLLTTPFVEQVNALIAGLIERTDNLAKGVAQCSPKSGSPKSD